MSYYPIFIELEGKNVLVVGGGLVAQRKVETFLKYGASIYIVSRELTDKLKVLVEAQNIRYIGEEFHEENLEGIFLVVAATDDKQLNHKISEGAHKRSMLINAVDQPDDCNFIVPSIVKKGDLSIAISTSGKSPALAKKIRKRLEAEYGSEYEIFLKIMGRLRNEILSKGLSQDKNSRIFHEIVDSGILKALARDDWEMVESILKKVLPKDVEVMDIMETRSVS
ncbi:MAG: bifunctional precorrin-2 dehydrogenase/sirohydrochlorin ferrochelatase [Desulfobacterales bacterium]|nr:bifunctional precorrin-2 dehydrogenase/sirohydrochlorin ferrochelatase [Desulfobacterales bacterium]